VIDATVIRTVPANDPQASLHKYIGAPIRRLQPCGRRLLLAHSFRRRAPAATAGLSCRERRSCMTGESDPDVWSGRASQEVSSICRFAVLHQCIRPLIGAVWCSGPSWISARVRSHYRTGLERTIWVTRVRMRPEERSSISFHPLAYRFQTTLNAPRCRRCYPNTIRRRRIRFKSIWGR
jgi:hypothetical protein